MTNLQNYWNLERMVATLNNKINYYSGVIDVSMEHDYKETKFDLRQDIGKRHQELGQLLSDLPQDTIAAIQDYIRAVSEENGYEEEGILIPGSGYVMDRQDSVRCLDEVLGTVPQDLRQKTREAVRMNREVYRLQLLHESLITLYSGFQGTGESKEDRAFQQIQRFSSGTVYQEPVNKMLDAMDIQIKLNLIQKYVKEAIETIRPEEYDKIQLNFTYAQNLAMVLAEVSFIDFTSQTDIEENIDLKSILTNIQKEVNEIYVNKHRSN